MAERITLGVGAHEPIFHRLRTGNSSAEEWRRWRRETSTENLDLLECLGVGKALIACTKGFGLEYEKPLIERAARFSEAAARRGIRTSVYVQGFPVYYETFFLEVPEAEGWLARTQTGDVIPWGGQTFRRWIDPTVEAFHDYQARLIEYVFARFTPCEVFMDNTNVAPSYTAGSRESFRRYLKARVDGEAALREFGIPGFDAVDLPRFDPVTFPPDAMRIVKDPMLQEWARWRSRVTADFLARMHKLVHSLSPTSRFNSAVGKCDGLRHNQLFTDGIDFEDRLAATDKSWMEESGWRPGVHRRGAADARKIVMDERSPTAARAGGEADLRIATDARWWKIYSNYGGSGHGGFWGETDRAGKLVAIAHNFAFSAKPHHLGTVGPLCAAPEMFDDIRDVCDWGDAHIDVLAGRTERHVPTAVWRGTSTLAFIRHTPVWEACAVEQMLFERHVPFTILLDGGLEKFLAGRRLLILPGTQCVSDRQVERITEFVRSGGRLLLLGSAGTRDERTRVRREYAFAHLFGAGLPNLEHYGPPHWVPELDFARMPERLAADFGSGKVAMVRRIVPATDLDLTRDPYMPERQVMVKDIVPPANEAAIMAEIDKLLGERLGASGPRWTLCEYWRRGTDLLVCLANLRKDADGGPVRIALGPLRATTARMHALFEDARDVTFADGTIEIDELKRFAVLELTKTFE